ncbi:MAG: macro domain-containing protein [Bacilli bacterium]|nr:macro domain-containing protein [Bacilli bacterium]
MKEELIDKLLNYFINENKEYLNIDIPNNIEEKRQLLRGLINLREPIGIDEEVLKLEDKLLQIELNEKGIVDVLELPEIEKNISLYLGDITTLKTDAIVNAGNNYGLGCFNPTHKCIDNTIHTYSGIRLRLECNDKLKGKTLNNGKILVCNGYNLPSKYVITTVGPEIRGQITKQDEIDLSNCYKNALKYAIDNNFKSIVFPSISTGLFGYPISKAKLTAYNSVKELLKDNDIKVIFNVYSKEDYDEYQKLWNN